MPEPRIGRHRGTFCITIYEDGKRKRRSLGTRDPDEAKRRFAEYLSIRERSQGDTVGILFNRYAALKNSERITNAWRRLQPHFGHMHPHQITEDACRAYIEARRGQGISDGTTHTELVYLSAALNYAVKRGDIEKAPHVWKPRRPEPRDRCLTREEATALINAAAMPHVRLAIILMLGTAARIGALLDLTWDRVDFKRGLIHLKNPDKEISNKRRATIPMNNSVRAALEEARDGALSDYVIEWNGKKLQSIKRGFSRAAKRANLEDVTPHVLRHTAACWLAEARVSIEEIAEYLGHTDVRMTYRTYAKYRPEYLREASSVLEV